MWRPYPPATSRQTKNFPPSDFDFDEEAHDDDARQSPFAYGPGERICNQYKFTICSPIGA